MVIYVVQEIGETIINDFYQNFFLFQTIALRSRKCRCNRKDCSRGLLSSHIINGLTFKTIFTREDTRLNVIHV